MDVSFNILVVDDSQIIVRKLSMLLEKMGHKVVCTVATGRQAIAAYKALIPDIVTMDITMPDIDGIEATRTIMKEFPEAKIIMVTSHGQEQMVIDALKAGAKGYVLKPFQEQKVYEAIQKACKGVVVHKDKLKAVEEQREKDRLQREKELTENAKLKSDTTVQVSSELAAPNEPGTRSGGSSQIEANTAAQLTDAPMRQQARFCPECGSTIVATAKFCSGCGMKLA